MRVLFVSYELPFWPGGGGGQARHHFLLRELARRHEIDVLAFAGHASEAEMASVRPICHRLVTIPWDPSFAEQAPAPAWARRSRLAQTVLDLADPLPARVRRSALMPRLEEAIRAMSAENRYDICQVQTTEIADLRVPIPRPAFLAVSDVLSAAMAREVFLERGWRRRQRRWLEVSKVRRWEGRVASSYQGVFCLSPEERDRLIRLGVTRPITVVPPGVDLDHYRPSPSAPRNQDLILLMGNFEYAPNVDSARWFANEIMPLIRHERPATRLRLLGRGGETALTDLADTPGIELVGHVADERPSLAEAGVAVLPARLGVGVRMKVPVLWASGCPFVSTAIGVEGHPAAAPDENFLLAESPAELAAATLRIMGDRKLAERLAGNGRRAADAGYSWAAAAGLMEQEWQRAVEGMPGEDGSQVPESG